MQRRARRVTLRDVAAKAGVSPMAVSAVLNNLRSSVRVSETTRERIRDTARELGYSANAVARSIRSNRTGAIGIWTGTWSFNVDARFVAALLRGFQRGCARHHLDLLLHGGFRPDNDTTCGSPEANVAYGELTNGKIDGLVIHAGRTDDLIARLPRSHLALVAVGEAHAGIPSVRVDDASGAQALARHLYARGHRRVLYRTGEPGVGSQLDRQRTFADEAARLGLQISHLRFSHEHPRLSAEELALLDLRRSDRCTAVVGYADHAVFPVLAACKERGWRVPDDLAIAGFDGIDFYLDVVPWRSLTTVRLPWEAAAEAAITHLATLLAGGKPPSSTVLPATLVQGEST